MTSRQSGLLIVHTFSVITFESVNNKYIPVSNSITLESGIGKVTINIRALMILISAQYEI